MVRAGTLEFSIPYRFFSTMRFLMIFSSVLSILCFTSSSFAQTLTYEGTLFDSTDAVIAESGVKLKAEIFDNALVCVLYEREYALDLSNSAGQFSLDLAAGTAPNAQPHTANTLTQILSNASGNNITCANSSVRSFSGTFVKRQVRISILEINGVDITDIQLPAQDLEMVAFAGEAETSKKFTGAITGDVTGTSSSTKVTKIQGVAVDATSPTDGQVLKYDNSSGKYIPAVIDSAIIADNSVSVNDVDFASTSGINIPTLSAAPGAPSAGQIYYNSVDNKVYFYNGSGWIDTGAGGGDFLSNGTVAFSGNIKLNGNYLSGDGDNEGVFVEASTGNVGIGTTAPNAKFTVEGVMTLDQQAGDPTGTAGYGSVYAKNDGKLYYRDGTGTVSDLLAVGAMGTVTQVDAGTGMTGGSITTTGTIGLASTTVTGGAYGSATQVPSFTVDAQGRLTAAANIAITDNDTTYSAVTGGANGLMIAADKTKLDNIEISATGDQTPAEIITAAKTVDGSGSGLDADLLDGLSSASFVQTELDPQVDLVSSGKWCRGTGSQVTCDQNAPSAGDTGAYQVFTSSGTWTKPAGVDANQTVIVELWAGGGGGGKWGGGGGGGYIRLTLRAGDLGATESVTVGSSGSGVNGTGGTGGTSSFGAHGSVYGGGGGNVTCAGGGGDISAGTSGQGVYGNGGAGGGLGAGTAGGNGTGAYPGGHAQNIAGGGGGSGGSGGGAQGGDSFWGGGGAGKPAGKSNYGGGGGSGGVGGGTAGGISVHGGTGGASGGGAGSIPAGGGGGGNNGTGGSGGRGEIRIRVAP